MATATAVKPGLQHLAVEHRDGCPATQAEGKARLETWDVTRPRSNQYPLGGTVRRTRCVDCGADADRNVTTKTTRTEDELDD